MGSSRPTPVADRRWVNAPGQDASRWTVVEFVAGFRPMGTQE